MFNVDNSKIPYLEIGNRQGHTDYIDFLKFDEVTHPIMRGLDLWGRQFYVIKFLVNNEEKLMQTFFQRYSRIDSLWQGCGHATVNLIDTSGGMSKEQFLFLEQIINGEKVKLEEKHRPVKFANKNIKPDIFVELYDERKINAAITIQKYWRLCRYNPSYKMCERVQMNNFKLLSF